MCLSGGEASSLRQRQAFLFLSNPTRTALVNCRLIKREVKNPEIMEKFRKLIPGNNLARVAGYILPTLLPPVLLQGPKTTFVQRLCGMGGMRRKSEQDYAFFRSPTDYCWLVMGGMPIHKKEKRTNRWSMRYKVEKKPEFKKFTVDPALPRESINRS